MRFALMIEAQQGLSYADQVAVARRAEAAGFEAMFRSDHYLSFPGPSDDRTTDAWAVLAGLARETTSSQQPFQRAVLEKQRGCTDFTDAFGARQAIGRIPAQGDKVGHLFRQYSVPLDNLLGTNPR